MTDTFAKTARPLTAAIAWCDATSIYIEYPVKDPSMPPYICKYPKTLESLQFAFGILREKPSAQTTAILREHPAVKKVNSQISDVTKATAADIVRKMLKA